MSEKPKKQGKALAKANPVADSADDLADRSSEAKVEERRGPQGTFRSRRSPDEVAAEVRERFSAILQSNGPPTDVARKALVKELLQWLEKIKNQVAPEAPDTAFELLWSLLQLAPHICEREPWYTDGRQDPKEEYILGEVGNATSKAIEMIENLAPKLSLDPEELMDKIFESMIDDKLYLFHFMICKQIDDIDDQGLKQLKLRAIEFGKGPLEESELLAQGETLSRDQQIFRARDEREFKASEILLDLKYARGLC